MDTNDGGYNNYQVITTNYEEINETEDTIDTAKKLPSAAAQIDTALFTYISKVPIVAKETPVFKVIKYVLVYHQIIHQENHQLFLKNLQLQQEH